MEITIDTFCRRARERFDDLKSANAEYVEVLVEPQRDRLGTDEQGHVSGLINPMIFLAGVRSGEYKANAMARIAEVPFITLVVGTYGLGKTELMRQLCQYLEDNRIHDLSPRPLPINLALCKDEREILRKASPPSGESFAHLLFHHLASDEGDDTFASGSLLSAIYRGEVFLVLDGLDELAVSRNEYLGFWGGLANMLERGSRLSGATLPLFRIVITLRYELLSARDSDGGRAVRTLRRNIPASDEIAIYFLHLDLFDISRVWLYMQKRLPAHWFPEVRKHKDLLEILYRPLLLRIFCEMASGPKGDQMFKELERFRHPAQLIGEYVSEAARDDELTTAQNYIEPIHEWEPDALARECLSLYRHGLDSMDIDNLKNILGRKAGQVKDVWLSFHKCPFLRRSGDRIYFTHRSFFEFFVAKGVIKDMEDSDEKGYNFSSFDTLVLEVDARGFLKFIMANDDEWFLRTGHAYGLADNYRGEWEYPQDWAELEKERRALLNAMTEPENKEFKDKARGHVVKFMKRDHDHLHPRYLMYNYEAVAVFLKNNRGGDLQGIREDFKKELRDRLKKTEAALQSLPSAKSYLREPLELLVERILSIALRFLYDWATPYKEESQGEELKGLIRDRGTRNRISAILEDIEEAIFI